MKLLTVFFGCALLTFSFVSAEPAQNGCNGCKCTKCECTQESHCGCLKKKESQDSVEQKKLPIGQKQL